MRKTKKSLIFAAVFLVIAGLLTALGFLIKPKTQLRSAEDFSKDSKDGVYVKSDLCYVFPMYEQEKTKDGYTYNYYYVLGVNENDVKSIYAIEDNIYEETLSSLEDNGKYLGGGVIKINDKDKKVTVYGYAEDVPQAVKTEYTKSGTYARDITVGVSDRILKISRTPETITPKYNYPFFVGAGIAGFIFICLGVHLLLIRKKK